MSIVLQWYDIGDGTVFVRDPDKQGRWMKTHISVVKTGCESCGATLCEPCFTDKQGRKYYGVGTHWRRRRAAKYPHAVAAKGNTGDVQTVRR